jgi:hypothetical protein
MSVSLPEHGPEIRIGADGNARKVIAIDHGQVEGSTAVEERHPVPSRPQLLSHRARIAAAVAVGIRERRHRPAETDLESGL